MKNFNEEFFKKRQRLKFQLNTIEIDPSSLSRASKSFH